MAFVQASHRPQNHSHSVSNTCARVASQKHYASTAISSDYRSIEGSPPSNTRVCLTSHQANFFCPYCDIKTFAKRSDQKRHLLEQHEGRRQICTNCRRPIKRPYKHGICKGKRSLFEPVTWENKNGHGCGLCLSYFKDFDKWIRHIQAHQKNDGKQKDDWDFSLQLRSLLQNPDLVELIADMDIPIRSLTLSKGNYIEAKRILETARLVQHSEQLQTVVGLACTKEENHLSTLIAVDTSESPVESSNSSHADREGTRWWQMDTRNELCSNFDTVEQTLPLRTEQNFLEFDETFGSEQPTPSTESIRESSGHPSENGHKFSLLTDEDDETWDSPYTNCLANWFTAHEGVLPIGHQISL